MKKRKEKRKPKYINGCKGAISLFLAVLLTPFLSTAMILIDAGRYNSAVSVLDEAMGVSATSLLADYDPYLKDRWGLYAIEQDVDINKEYGQLLETNSAVMGDSIELDKVTASGLYNLQNSDILYSQIMDYSKLNAPTTLAMETLNLQELIDTLEQMANLEQYFNIISSGADAVDSSITIAEAAENLKVYARELDSLKEEYETKYDAFEEAVEMYVEQLNGEPAKGVSRVVYDAELQVRADEIVFARDEYSKTIADIVDALSEYKEEMESCTEAMASISNDISSIGTEAISLKNKRDAKEKELQELDDEISAMERDGKKTSQPVAYTQALEKRTQMEQELSQIYLEEGIANAGKTGLSSTTNGFQDSFEKYSEETMGQLITAFEELKETVDAFKGEEIDKDYVLKNSVYHQLEISGYVTESEIDAFLTEQAEELADSSFSDLVDGIIDLFNSLCKLKLFYDPALSSYINTDYYASTLGGLPSDLNGGSGDRGSVIRILENISGMMESSLKCKRSLVGLNWLNALKELKNFLNEAQSLVDNLIAFGTMIGTNVSQLVTGYDRLYYSTYMTYNLPCRTDFTSGSPSFETMTGYSLTQDSLVEKNRGSNLTVVDDIMVLAEQIPKGLTGSGKDLTFSGAELEYILLGANSEISNQMYTFACLYLIRLIADLPTISLNPEVQSLAASSTIGYPVVMLLEYLVEPLVDTILLVNGAEVPLVKSKVYLTPSGCIDLVMKVFPMLGGMSSSEKSSLENGLTKAFGASEDDLNYQKTLASYEGTSTSRSIELFKMSYREYCFLILLLTVSEEQQMDRLSNLIQMETLYYYKNQGKPYAFNLDNSYSYIQMEADVSIKQIMPSLADSSLFSTTRKLYRGY